LATAFHETGHDYTQESPLPAAFTLFTGNTLNYYSALNNTSYFYSSCSIIEKPNIALSPFKNIRKASY
jgi:hypothetical protein